MRELTWTAFAIDAATGAFLALVFLWLYRSYRYRFLWFWTLSWIALCVHHVAGIGAMWAYQALGLFHPGRTAISALSVLAGYWQAVWLLFGTYEGTTGRRGRRRIYRAAFVGTTLFALASVLVKVETPGLVASDVRLFFRIGLYGLASGVAFTVAGSHVAARLRGGERGFGLALLGIGFACLALQGFHTFVLQWVLLAGWVVEVPDYAYYLGFVAAFFNVIMGIGAIVWFLEREQRRVSEMLEGRRQAEQERQALLEKVHHAQKMEALGKVAGGIAHDFNNVLTVIASHVAILQDEPPGDDARESLEEIGNAARRASGLTRQLLAFGRRQMLKLEPIDMCTVVRETEKMLGRVLGEGIRLEADLPEGASIVLADRSQLDQILMNLVINARDAMNGRGRIRIGLRFVDVADAMSRGHTIISAGRYWVLYVRDGGCGIPPELRERIFEPFFTTKARGKGTGLGLSSVYGIVTQSGGHVVVDSVLGKGTTFEIYLPQVGDEEEAMSGEDTLTLTLRGTERVLVVDDDPQVRRLVGRVLRAHGYLVEEARDDVEALRLIRDSSEQIDLLVTDIRMPDITGPELATELARVRPQAAVLFMSGHVDAALEEGLSDVMHKPFDPTQLARRVRKLLDGQISTEVNGVVSPPGML